jgi:hypothetical protein
MHGPASGAASRTGCAQPDTTAPDIGLGVLIVAGTLGYLALWPYDIRCVDEGSFLYESKRLLHGDRFFRDIFEILPPGSFYVMAGAFWLFGTTFAVARATAAALQAAICLGVFAICRAGGVRRELAAATAIAHLALCGIAWPVASYHWFTAALALALLGMCLSTRWLRRPLFLGVVAGAAFMVQQHKGIVLIGATGLVVAMNALLDNGPGQRRAALAHSVGLFLAGAAAVTIPPLIGLVHSAGGAEVYRALVAFPLGDYAAYEDRRRSVLRQLGTVPAVVRYLPVAAGWVLARAVRAWRRDDRRDARRAATLAVFCLWAVVSASYSIDYPHFAMVAAVWLVAAADLLEAALRALAARTPRARIVGNAAAVFLIGTLGWRLVAVLPREPFRPVQTAFGRVDLLDQDQVALIDALNAGLAGAPERELFAYPFYPWLYLMLDAKNATRYQILIPGYNSPEQMQEVMSRLASRPPPFAVVQAYFVTWNDDPVVKALQAGFERVPLQHSAQWPAYGLFRRRTPAETAQQAPSL